jgi:hypothetical protein
MARSSPSASISVRSAVSRMETVGPVVSRFSVSTTLPSFEAARLDRTRLVLHLPLHVTQVRDLLAAQALAVDEQFDLIQRLE